MLTYTKLVFIIIFVINTDLVYLRGENMAEVNKDMLLALKRKRGEENISVIELARQTGVSRWTLDKLLTGKSENIRPTTAEKINEWLYKLI